MGPKTIELIDIVIRIESLLERNTEDHWLRAISRSRALIELGKFEGISKLVGILRTGGTGSFNDIMLITISDDEEFRKLKNEAFNLATYIEQHAEVT